MDKVFPKHCQVAASSHPTILKKVGIEPNIKFGPFNSSVDDYLSRNRTTGLLIIKGDEILVERYQYDRTRDDRFLSNSMAKTVLSLAVGVALQEGRIASLDDVAARYEPALSGTAYGETTIRNLLRMSSGVKFMENYSGDDDFTRWFGFAAKGGSILASQQFNDREAPQGQRFHYASSETEVLNLVLRKAVGKTLCAWATEKIWQPLGAESDAIWLAASFDGVEYASFGFNATLRDYARLAMLLANNGMVGGRTIVPEEYLLEATRADRQPKGFRPGELIGYGNWGYGYQTWIFPGERPDFALLGVYGQMIFVDPVLKLALVITSVGRAPLDTSGIEARELWQGLLKYFAAQ
jgi:CubicO group peptidase (beta-lactamase class C family)